MSLPISTSHFPAPLKVSKILPGTLPSHSVRLANRSPPFSTAHLKAAFIPLPITSPTLLGKVTKTAFSKPRKALPIVSITSPQSISVIKFQAALSPAHANSHIFLGSSIQTSFRRLRKALPIVLTTSPQSTSVIKFQTAFSAVQVISQIFTGRSINTSSNRPSSPLPTFAATSPQSTSPLKRSPTALKRPTTMLIIPLGKAIKTSFKAPSKAVPIPAATLPQSIFKNSFIRSTPKSKIKEKTFFQSISVSSLPKDSKALASSLPMLRTMPPQSIDPRKAKAASFTFCRPSSR